MPKPVEKEDFRLAPWQQNLFARSLPNLILFVRFESVTESDFLSAVLNTRPKFVLDLRIAPRFDLGSLNRRLVFSIFQQVEAEYYDVTGKLGIRSNRDARLNPPLLVEELRATVFRRHQRIEGPLVFLVGDSQSDESYETALARNLDALSDSGWEFFRVPAVMPEKRPVIGRDTVFISHATPEDSEFARWLAAHLTNLGYKVWTDVTKLIGGEEFWDNIEETIRDRSAKVVVCLSRTAQAKKGVLDEIAFAVGIERSRGLDDFVVPIRLDDLPFSDVRANIGRKNIIDFSENWAAGFAALVDVFDRDGVSKSFDQPVRMDALLARLRRKAISTLVDEPERVFANWLAIESLPDALTFVEFEGPIHQCAEIRRLIPWPTFELFRLIGGFAHADEIQTCMPHGVRIAHRCTVSTDEFLAGRAADLPTVSAHEARNRLVHLLKSSWRLRAEYLGLNEFTTAAGTKAWYPPIGLKGPEIVHFIGPEGFKKRKSLVGRSEKRGVFWHFSVEPVPVLADPRRIVLRQHVVFSEDGKTLIPSTPRMHALRRGFCKSWWNDRWRDLSAAYASWFAQGAASFELEMSPTEAVRIESRLIELTSPISLLGREEVAAPNQDPVSESDWADDPELDDEELAVLNEASDPDDAGERVNDVN